jgi:hypothetical protein
MLILQNQVCFEGYDKKIPLTSHNEKYDVFLNGKKCFINMARVSKVPFNRPWEGTQRPLEQTEINGFINFASDSEVEVIVDCKMRVDKAVLKPLNRKIDVTIKENRIMLNLKNNGQYVLEINGQHEVLHIFYDSMEEYKDKKSATYYFGPGIHRQGIINLKDDESIYVDRDAVVLCSVLAEKAKNIKIFGSGILDGSMEERISPLISPASGCYDGMTVGNIRMYDCENVSIDGVVLRDSSIWAASFFGCNNVRMNNIKIIGQWRYNTDGIDLTNTSNVEIYNSFIRSFDDAISIKGIYDYDKAIENIKVDNCILWCGWGKSCELGAETSAKEFKNIYFSNIECIHNSIAAMDIQNCNDADIHDIYFRNINVEYPIDEQKKMLQESDESKYIADSPEICALIKLDNRKTVYKFEWENGIYGSIHDIYFNNINAYVEDRDIIKPIIHVCSHKDDLMFYDINIKGIFVNEQLAQRGDFEVICQNASIKGMS